MFRKWLINEMGHYFLEMEPTILTVDGKRKKVTGIDFKWEDFGQEKLTTLKFVQEFPYGVGNPGQVFVNAGYWDGYWIDFLIPEDLEKLKRSKKVFVNTKLKKISFVNRGIECDVNPLDKFNKIDPYSIKEPDGSLAKFRPPYDKKSFLTWWDFVELTDGQDIIKQPARVR